jgi:hypothetical protein
VKKYDVTKHMDKPRTGTDSLKNEMDGACSTCGGKKRCIQDFGGET